MAVQLWPHRRHTDTDPVPDERVADGSRAQGAAVGAGTTVKTDTDDRTVGREATGRRPLAWPRSRRGGGTDTVTIDRRRWRRLRRHQHNPISRLIWAAGWTAALILLAGMLVTWIEANPANALVGGILDMGTWLATPFHDLFRDTDPQRRLYLNWGVAAAAYYVLGRVVSWLVRW